MKESVPRSSSKTPKFFSTYALKEEKGWVATKNVDLADLKFVVHNMRHSRTIQTRKGAEDRVQGRGVPHRGRPEIGQPCKNPFALREKGGGAGGNRRGIRKNPRGTALPLPKSVAEGEGGKGDKVRKVGLVRPKG